MTTTNDSDVKDTKEGGEGDGGNADLTPEQIKQLAQDKKLADENKNTRLKLRDAEKREADLKARLEAIEEERANGTATDREAKSELAKLQRETAELRKENKERKEREATLEEKTRSKTISSALSSIVGKLQDPASAVELLKGKAKVAADDTVVFLVKDPDTGEMVEKEATLDNIKAHKLLPDIYYPPVGVPGSGGRGGDSRFMTKDGKSPIDLDRAATDFKYYNDNREAVMAARRAQKASQRS